MQNGVAVEYSRVLPSGRETATRRVPILPAAPGLSSTMNLPPRRSLTSLTSRRAITSVLPPDLRGHDDRDGAGGIRRRLLPAHTCSRAAAPQAAVRTLRALRRCVFMDQLNGFVHVRSLVHGQHHARSASDGASKASAGARVREPPGSGNG